MLRVTDIKEGYLFLRSPAKVSTETYDEFTKKHQPKQGDIVISRVGTYGVFAYVATKDKFCLGQNTAIIIPHINKKFLYYSLISAGTKEYLNRIVTGSTQKTISLKNIKAIPLSVPNDTIQERIADTLSALDDKIELNNKINENLERQARALLTQWLIENDGAYEVSLLSDVAIINPDTYSPKDAWEYVNYLDTSSITDGIISEVQHIKPSTEKLPSRARRILAANDVVFSTVRPNQRHFGIINDPLDHMLASTGFAVIRSKRPCVSNELLYLRLTEDSFIEKMQQLAEQSTSTFPSIKAADLGSCEIPYPISQDLTEILKAVFTCIANNQKENRALAKFRDSLLPKLMSGEIDVSNIDL